jgi:hypothetical protein
MSIAARSQDANSAPAGDAVTPQAASVEVH